MQTVFDLRAVRNPCRARRPGAYMLFDYVRRRKSADRVFVLIRAATTVVSPPAQMMARLSPLTLGATEASA